jgi:membrane associated rhomboid family serine protease
MGIYDRDYVRADSPRGRGAAGGGGIGFRASKLLGLSITAWIIAINVAVFVFDAFAEKTWRVESSAGIAVIDPAYSSRLATVTDRKQTVTLPDGFTAHPIGIDDGTGKIGAKADGSPNIVGFERFQLMPPLKSLGHFSTGKGFSELQVWRMIFFQFLHADINHLLFNMLGLFFFAPLIERYLGGGRRYLAFYLMCGICGALFYLVLNLLGAGFGLRLPGVLVNDTYTPLIGASAGCFGILIAAAFVAGDEEMLFFGIIPMKVRTGAYLMAAIAAANLIWGGKNAGGDAAHIGGAIAGWFFIRRPYLLREFFDFFGPGRSKIKSPANSGGRSPAKLAPPTMAERKRLDEVLDKVHREGLNSLTDGERQFLQGMKDR